MSQLTTRLLGKRVAAVLTNGHVLSIRAHDGTELEIVWLDDNGVPVRGKPALHKAGVRISGRGLLDIINSPNLTRHGVPE